MAGTVLVYGDPVRLGVDHVRTTPAASLDELVAALSAQASRDASPPVDVTVGGHPGKVLTLHVPEDAVFSDCDGGGVPHFDRGPERRRPLPPGTGPDRRACGSWTWTARSSSSTPAYFAATPAEYVEEMRAMVESATFEAR